MTKKRKESQLERAAMRWYHHWTTVATDKFIVGSPFDKLLKAAASHAKKGKRK